ncbi:MAG: aspartyl/asparaginyl beta-hydroxylase domain-containing protein [Planctomycetota bacterium]
MHPALLPSVLGLFLGSSLYFHVRGRLRFKLVRQLTDYSTLLAPYNAFVSLCTAGGSRPIHDKETFPELKLLRDNWHVIRDEAVALLDAGAVCRAERHDDLVFYAFMKRGWKRFYLKWYRDFVPSARRLCPRTVELLARVPCVRGAMFTVLLPQSRLGKHRDPFAGTLRYHLGLSTPNSPQCWLRLDDRSYVWRDGDDLLFDSSYVHSAHNKTDHPRLVLFCDVHRPMRGPLSRAINGFVVRHVVPLTQVANVPGDPIGVGNRVFLAMRPLRAAIAWLRAGPAPVYVAAKLGVLALVVWALWP